MTDLSVLSSSAAALEMQSWQLGEESAELFSNTTSSESSGKPQFQLRSEEDNPDNSGLREPEIPWMHPLQGWVFFCCSILKKILKIGVSNQEKFTQNGRTRLKPTD